MVKREYGEAIRVSGIDGLDITITNSTLEPEFYDEELMPHVVILVSTEEGWFDLRFAPKHALRVADALRQHAGEMLHAQSEQLRTS